MFTVLMALALFGCSGMLVARAIALPRGRAAQQLDQIASYGFTRPAEPSDAAGEEVGWGPVTVLGRLVGASLSRERRAGMRKELLSAALYDTPVEKYIGYVVISLIATPLLMVYVAISSQAQPAMAAAEVLGGGLIGMILPRTLVKRKARLRLDQIEYEMPELTDLLVVGVESGMGFNGAVRLACQRVGGPLGDELRLVLREQSLGASMTEALKHMLERAETPSTRSFVRTIVQGERLGVSIGHMMRSLAEEMRKRRKAAAEERANKAPLKMLFPLVFLIFPALFIVMMTPAAIGIMKTLGG